MTPRKNVAPKRIIFSPQGVFGGRKTIMGRVSKEVEKYIAWGEQ